MSTSEQQPIENLEVIRDLIALPESEAVPEDGGRSPTKTERDFTTEVLSEADAAIDLEVKVVRERVVSEPQPE
jgi:hypothetical protein